MTLECLVRGYQGEMSVHTRGLRHMAGSPDLARSGINLTVEPDVTVTGGTAYALFTDVERQGGTICYMASGYLTARVPALAVLDLPFLVENRDIACAALDGRAGVFLRREVERLTGYRVLAFWDNGFRHISNRLRPIRTPEDCSGLVIRTLDSQIYQDTLASFSFTPRVTDVRELRRAIATGEVDAQENPLTNLLNFEIWRYHPYVSLTAHLFGVALLVCSAAWFAGLPATAARALATASEDAARQQRTWAAQEDEGALDRLLALGVTVLSTEDIDRSAFMRCAASVIAREVKLLPPELVEAYRSQV